MNISLIDSGTGRLAVELAGPGPSVAPCVVMSPAMGDTRDAFAPLVATLVAGGYRTACADLRGHGDSGTSFDRYGDDATADDLASVVDFLGDERVVLAGASMSAAAAVIAAGRRPDRVAGLVLFAPFLRNRGGRFARWGLQAALVRPWGPAVWRAYAARLWPGLGAGAAARAARSTALLARPGRWAAFRKTAATDHRVVAPWLGRVRIPVLVVMGDADPDWPDPLAEAAWVASNFDDAAVLAVPGAGHAPMLERPDVVGPAVLAFLERIRAEGAFGAGDAPAAPRR